MTVYESCRWIERCIVLDYNGVIRNCNNFNPSRGGRTVIFDEYKGPQMDWDDFFRIKHEYRKPFLDGTRPEECVGCTGTETRDWDQRNYLDYVLLTPWVPCNSKCVYCHARDDKSIDMKGPRYDVVALAKDMIDKGIIDQNTLIDFAGGEPTIFKDFKRLLDLFLKHKFKKILIHTNAITHHKNIEEGIRKGSIYVLVSVDAGSKVVHEKVKQVKSYDKVWKNLALYARAQKPESEHVKTKFIIVPGLNDSQEEILLWLDKSYQLGIKNVILNLDFNWLENNISNIPMSLYNLIAFTKSEAEKRGMFCELYGELFRVKCEIEQKVEYNKAGYLD